MKQLTLIKTSRSIQLAHLYEHIFYAHVVAFFRKNNLFQRLDYSLEAETYDHGAVCISLKLYTPAAVALTEYIPTLRLKFDNSAISIAATQLLAEKEQPFGNAGFEIVKGALEGLHAQPWQNIDQLRVLDTKVIRKASHPFYIAEGSPLPSRKLAADIVINAKLIHSRREFLPLFRETAWLIMDNLQDELSDTYGYYGSVDSFRATKHKAGLIKIFKVAHANDAYAEDCLATCLKIIRELYGRGIFSGYMAELRKISYYKHSDLAPSMEKTYEDTLIIMGAAGWHEVATAENCELLLQQMSIELRIGKQHLVHPLITAN